MILPTSSVSVDAAEVKRALDIMVAPSATFEIRLLGREGDWAKTWSGFFAQSDVAAAAVASFVRELEANRRGGCVTGVYVTLNPVIPDLRARRCDRLALAGKGETTGDAHILRRTRILLDVDAARPSGISASDVEHGAAIRLVSEIEDDLRGLGWPSPLRGDSGNGGHLVYAVDLEADDGGLVGRLLTAAHARYGCDVDGVTLKVDTAVANPARISKVFGTMARKGDHTVDRPHRMARILSAPDRLAVVGREQLEMFIGKHTPSSTATANKRPPSPSSSRGLDLSEWLARHGIEVRSTAPWQGGTMNELSVCPVNPDHVRGEAHVEQHASGAISAGCHHESCSWDWAWLREKYDGPRPPGTTGQPRLGDDQAGWRAHSENATKSILNEEDERFEIGKGGRPKSSQKNILLALDKLGVVVSYDMFADRELVRGLVGRGPEIDDAAMVRLQLLIDKEFKFLPKKDLLYDVVSDQARQHAFHPVRDYLDALTWDGVSRISSWLADCGGAEDTELTRAISRIVLIAAVRRVRNPGCKFDEMVVFESPQGSNKSTGLATLAVEDQWFVDDLPLNADTKRLMEVTTGKWIVEAGELRGMSRADVTSIKAYLSRQTDEARMAYGRKKKTIPRQFIVIGTTNETAGYLKDTTGNRRFWPVRVKAFDLECLRRDRDQLWAEAAHAEAAGESIRLDSRLYAAAALEQDARCADDPFEMLLDEALRNITGKFKIVDAWKVVGIEPGAATQDQATRLGAVMRKHGWVRARRRFDGALEYAYVRGTNDEQEHALELTWSGGRAFVARCSPRSGRSARSG